jgi:hypothetical protein
MDAHVFRQVAEELARELSGARLEKIHNPAPDITVFGLYAHGRKLRLVLRSGRHEPCLFFTRHAFSNPQRPSAAVMRLRKYAGDRRLGEGLTDFSRRRLAFHLPGDSGLYLVLDLRGGPYITAHLPEDFNEPPLWPDVGVLEEICGKPLQRNAPTGPWQLYSVLTPRLRDTLAHLELLDGRALLVDLEAGGGDLFFYVDAVGIAVCSAWPLPDAVARAKKLVPLTGAEALPGVDLDLLGDFPYTAAIGAVDAPMFFADLKTALVKAEEDPIRREKKRRARLEAKLDAEAERLRGMIAGKEDALLLQAQLWRFSPDDKTGEVILEDSSGESRRLVLNPLLTVRENMELLFRKAAKGVRGLSMVEERRRADMPARSRAAAPGGSGGEAGDTASVPKQVARFLSSDGYVLWRGKNAEGNRTLVKQSRPHDYWLHVKDGPGAHVLIRRAHAADDVPERTVREAACLAGLKSLRSEDDRAEILLAEARRVQPVKGGPAGTVRVDVVLRTVLATLDSSLEAALLPPSGTAER